MAMDNTELLGRIDHHLETITVVLSRQTEVLSRQTDEIAAQREDFRDESVRHREELAVHREELVALRQTSDLQLEELRRQSDRSNMLTHAVVRALDRLDGPRPA